MKVLLVNDYRRAGGCEVMVEQIREGLAARGHEVLVFTSEDVPGYRRTPLGYVDSRACRHALEAKLNQFIPEVVHLHNFYHELSPGILATLRAWKNRTGGRVVMTVHDFHIVCPNAGMRYFRGGKPRIAALDRRLTLGQILGRRWDHRGFGYSALKILQHVWNYRLLKRRRVIDLFISPSRFLKSMLECNGLTVVWLPNPAPAPAIHKPERSPDELHLAFVGRVEPEKGLAEFLAALPSNFPGRLEIVGDGSALAACREVVSDRKLEHCVEFVGIVDRDEALRRIARAQVVVLPSRWPENSPVSLVEALACGTSILTSDMPGGKEIVSDSGVGDTFDIDSPDDVVRALSKIVTDFERGTLNEFDVSEFLKVRDEQGFMDRMVELYDVTPRSPIENLPEPCAS